MDGTILGRVYTHGIGSDGNVLVVVLWVWVCVGVGSEGFCSEQTWTVGTR